MNKQTDTGWYIALGILLAAAILVWGFLALLSKLPYADGSPSVMRRTAIYEGMPRETAIDEAGKNAWYHQPCYYQDAAVHDLFFYQSHEVSETLVFAVYSHKNENGEWVVYGSMTLEDFAWPELYKDCLDMSRFEDPPN